MTTKNPLRTRLSNREVVYPQPTKANSHQDDATGAPFTAIFAGTFLLTNPLGTLWNDLAQSGALVFSENANALVGGVDQVKIIADGNTITVPGAWKNVGNDEITISAGTINRMMVLKTASEIHYIVKTEAP